MAVELNSVIVAALLKQHQSLDESFLQPIASRDNLVNNNTINFNKIGAPPDVLIDNITYPIGGVQRIDDKEVVVLKKLDSVNTIITDDELFALAYNKESSVRDDHSNSLMRTKLRYAAWALAGQSDTTNTPVISTTGTLVNGRRKMLPIDLINLKRRCDDLQIDMSMRKLVLSTKHTNDLIEVDQTFRDRFNDTATGQLIPNIYGFDIYSSVFTPKYTVGANTKKAYGAVASSNDADATVFFSPLNCFKATGDTTAYYQPSKTDPHNRQTVFGVRQYFIVSPVENKYIGAIVDGQ